jgi:hypothetical protein
VSWLKQFPLQQSQVALQLDVASLQVAPSGLQPFGFLHVPIVAPAGMLHVTGVTEPPGKPAAPQQSLSCVHRSPATWHPLGGSQIKAPVGRYGVQSPLQQPPPHVEASHTSPSRNEQEAGELNGVHVPNVEPGETLHDPLQQSEPAEQTSPLCWQYDETAHLPLRQSLEAQSEFCVQSFPSVPAVEFSAAQAPLEQLLLQQLASVEHGWPSAAHDGKSQTPPVQTLLQQSLPAVHGSPSDARQSVEPTQLPPEQGVGVPVGFPLGGVGVVISVGVAVGVAVGVGPIGHAPGAGAALRLIWVASFFTSVPPHAAQ